MHFKPFETSFDIHKFSDSDWARSIDDMKSISGACIFLIGNLVYHVSKKQSTVVRSSTKVEYRALTQFASEVLWITYLLDEFRLTSTSSISMLWCDNLGSRSLGQNIAFHLGDKHFEINLHFIKLHMELRKLDMQAQKINWRMFS